jgi:glucose/arabinose dehydrogenase
MKFFGALLLSLIAFDIASSQSVQKKVIVPPQFQSQFDTNPTVTIDDRFDISVYYTGSLKRPRFMAMGPNNVLYVADMNNHGVFALKDTNEDGIADTTVDVIPSVDTVHSLAFYRQYLYAAEPSRIRRFEDKDGDGFYETETPFISGIGAAGPYNHFTRTIYIDSAEGYIYLGVGASCNACRESDSERASVLRFNLDGSGRMVFASGLRNALGVTKGPFGDIWVTNADRDNLGDYVPPEIITHIHQGGFYGWPFAYGDKQYIDFSKAPEFQSLLPLTAADSARIDAMDVADIFLPAHSTPMEILNYQSGASIFNRPTFLVAIHGSSPGGKPIATGYKVISAQYDFTSKKWNTSDFITGFLTDTINYTYWGRPCGLAEDSINNIVYLSCDAGTPAIFKITPSKKNSVSVPKLERTIYAYPNPTHGSVSLNIPISVAATIDLFDVLGRSVSHTTRRNGENITIDIQANDQQVIYCRVTTGSGVQILPIVLE